MGEEFRQRQVQCVSASGLHRLAYTEWGDPGERKVLVCVHGLTRCGRDFDALARTMASDYRVVCPDVPGRGLSGWLKNPMEYRVETYIADMVTLLARLDADSVHWLGTSMGGLIGMTLASLAETPLQKLVLNDVGPIVSAVSLARIGEYLGKAPQFPDFATAVQYVRAVSATFGAHSDAQWSTLTEHVVRRQPEGSYRMHYDPAIAVPFSAAAPEKDIELWPCYDAIRCPTLVIRGALSDLLKRETMEEMASRGPRAKTVEIAHVGHAPTLMHADQIAVVRDFLLAD
ncbi:MAG: alpha/beta hydrolase [Betaproteobacteria bacterium RIFCSPLOWO2_12_FULL_64_23]|nr:MAG: alpha/beta hydrolase [Betaproteobacteria bacterium RIFCSPLOWO2_12_FULL_64_23]